MGRRGWVTNKSLLGFGGMAGKADKPKSRVLTHKINPMVARPLTGGRLPSCRPTVTATPENTTQKKT